GTCSSYYSLSVFSVVCFPIQHPSKSTLFPYTTLFRSQTSKNADCGLITATSPASASTAVSAKRSSEPASSVRPHERSSDGCGSIDRKSTRLNSSHVKISYAVFCLKKKKK